MRLTRFAGGSAILCFECLDVEVGGLVNCVGEGIADLLGPGFTGASVVVDGIKESDESSRLSRGRTCL